ncbi:hypothetical protein [Polyangium jinanense]|uniref:Uncharacterized protein n=1 Tax=Polyangium jinanense TaxID=2829994 RepID=A0A9X3XF28_9BACT|nr:hypothetical protein [Polyangium jinanense]MDC3961259.1 hypothetical protein [Polyangium jinanense]MDC3988962.1 hypothetical protein [Polyangium jinanense]
MLLVVGASRGCGGAQPCADLQDDDPCTLDQCESGTATHSYLGDGHPCFRGNLHGMCHFGICLIPCSDYTDCVTGLPCNVAECTGGHCAIVQADKVGSFDDGNPCTKEGCVDGELASWPLPDGTPPDEPSCAECLEGACSTCNLPTDCGQSTSCLKWVCVQGQCAALYNDDGYPSLENGIPGDCQKWVCDGKGGTRLVADIDDAPKIADTCMAWTCIEWTPVVVPWIDGEICIMESGVKGRCNAMGDCVQCMVDGDCPGMERCLQGACTTCHDGVQNNGETDTDCGANCGKCGGTPCDADSDCASGYCAFAAGVGGGKVCCDAACDGVCKECDLTGACKPVPFGQPDVDTCNSPAEGCAGTTCKIKKGYSCQYNSDCISNSCTNHICL